MSMGSPTEASATAPATDETTRLIAAEKVNGTAVYNRQGEHLGTIEDVMLDKVSGKVSYAVLSFGGFLGIGTNLLPLPWGRLRPPHGARSAGRRWPESSSRGGRGDSVLAGIPRH